MANIRINSVAMIDGKVTANRILDKSQNPPRLIVEGALQTKEYIEEIFRIETARFTLEDVEVFHESFGTEDDEIVYVFTAGNLIVAED